MSDGKKDSQNLDKNCELEKDECTRTKPLGNNSMKCDFIQETYEWIIRNHMMAYLFFMVSLFFIAVIYATRLINQLSEELEKKPCETLLCYQENRKLQDEIQSFFQSVNNINARLQKLEGEMQHFRIKVNNLENGLQKVQNYSDSIDKKVEENHSEVITKNQKNVIIICVTIFSAALFIGISIKARKRLVFFKHNMIGQTTTRDLSNVPGVVYFSCHQEPYPRSWTDKFLKDREFNEVLITDEKDLPKINSKLVFLFIDCNDRNIILEGTNDTSSLKRKTVKTIENDGGQAVVIYCFHPDSRQLGYGRLFSETLTSIQNHPDLKKLSQENCVLSIYKEFSEYQMLHLTKLLRMY